MHLPQFLLLFSSSLKLPSILLYTQYYIRENPQTLDAKPEYRLDAHINFSTECTWQKQAVDTGHGALEVPKACKFYYSLEAMTGSGVAQPT